MIAGWFDCRIGRLVGLAILLGLCRAEASVGRLFPAGLPHRQWVEFKAEGYKTPVWGTIYGTDKPPVTGVPLGGIGTGCLDIDTDGTLGYCTVFSHVWGHGDGADGGTMYRDRIVGANGQLEDIKDPSRGKMGAPFLQMWVDGNFGCILTTYPSIVGIAKAKQIDYWGHYPVLDIRIKLDGPVAVGMRAWSPFIPGDAIASNVLVRYSKSIYAITARRNRAAISK